MDSTKQVLMKLLSVKRKTKTESRYSPNMGDLTTNVTYIKKYCAGIPFKTIHKYRETYYGKVKSCEECNLSV